MDGIILLIKIVIGIQLFSSAIMCVFGYKWSRLLIATTGLYIGIALGIGVAVLFGKVGAGSISLWAVPVVALIFYYQSYKSIILNHFLAGFLLTVKLTFLILVIIGQSTDIELSSLYFIMPIIMGIVVGFVVIIKCENNILLLCLAFIGATEFVPKLFQFFNGALFAITDDLGYLFDPASFIFGLFGIEIPSVFEGFVILAVFCGSYYYQKKKVEELGINLSGKILDDSNM